VEDKRPILVMKYMEKKFKMNSNKKGISGVVATVILIALVLAVVAIVWGVVTNLVSEQLEEAGSCFEVFDKVSLNNQYTCYNATATPKNFQFSINIGDADINEVVVMISAEGTTKSYSIADTPQDIGLTFFHNKSNEVWLPGKNEGFTYVADFSSKPDSVQIAPVVNGKRCEISDSITNIGSCSLFA